ncbi:PLP-dependent transferase [Gonapodya prolifera JEL478]|uniref:PLP-dependent transferase n=1 Tax=Gonapodya prolifera (strain JEL478) TaxID=1344416 RepID=A0A139A4J3_GONPJ|nr:PLP-dependent transferase [Gonapodya prolifera JEL478]|eukprot:KXS11589.1 PLP-dependent transferase [Gonapodya prolifera JEL478]
MADLPEEPENDYSALLAAFERDVIQYPFASSAAPIGIIASFLASRMNAALGYPSTSADVLVSGGSVANIVWLAAMRFKMGGGSYVKEKGFLGMAKEGWEASKPMVVYTSTEGHRNPLHPEAIELLGIGSSYLRKIPVIPSTFQLSIPHVQRQIAADRLAGLRPVCVVASAGTVNTGAIDNLDEIANVCECEGLWFHIDWSYDAPAVIVDGLKGLYKGMERADSLVVDQHKWFYVPIDCGCSLVKSPVILRQTFSLVPLYHMTDRALPWFSEFSIELTLPFRAAKLWLTIQSFGRQGYLPSGGANLEEINRLQDAIADLVHSDGRCFLATTMFPVESLGTRPGASPWRSCPETPTRLTALRACIVNFRVTDVDLEALLDVVCECGERAWNEIAGVGPQVYARTD